MTVALLVSALAPAGPVRAAAGPGSAGVARDAGPAGPPVAVRQPAGALPGIDVSHWQETIDWAAVAASGQRFAIAKATEGQTYVDPMYATNKAGAEANGIAFGAYHFARPDGTTNDAVLEADHFVDVAQLVQGNLIPVLDIERTGGLTQPEVTQWILAWLGRVTERLGVRPMVYTSPNGWETRTGDTTAVADAGYTVLWVAHWGVAEPRLPAEEWSGNGWRFWQYSNCGSIPGIDGCVDVDWFDGPVFDEVSIPSPDVTPPTVTLAPSTDVVDPTTVLFDEIVHGVTPANVAIRSLESGEVPPVAQTCRSRRGVDVDCVTGNVRSVLLQPLSPLVPGDAYEAAVNPAGVTPVVVDRGANPAPTTAQAFAAPTDLDEGSAALGYSWRSASSRNAFGRSYAVERRAGAAATFAFRGRSVTWYTATGPTYGRAAVWIDGRRVGLVDLYAARTAFRVARTFGGLARADHTISIRVLGTSARAATDTQVVVDAFDTAGGRIANPGLSTTWGTERVAGAAGGRVAAADLGRSSVVLTFRGTGVAWSTTRGPDQGMAEVLVDGSPALSVDNYASRVRVGVVREISGLADGLHTLRIVVLGRGRPAADGTLVSIDGLVVLG